MYFLLQARHQRCAVSQGAPQRLQACPNIERRTLRISSDAKKGVVAKLRETAQTVLSAFKAQLEAQGVELPERQYVAPGQGIPWDGEQLVVTLMSVGQGQPGAPFSGTYRPGAELLMAQFAVAIVRTVPSLSGESFAGPMTPSAEELGTAGLAAMDDAQALIKAAIALHAAESVTGLGMGFEIGDCAPVGPEGGMTGHRQLIAISLGGPV
jgi:hypothetical protein